MRRVVRDEAGISMIEVVVTLFITLLVLSTLTAFFVNANSSSLANTRQVDVLSLAQKQIENIRQLVKQSPNGFATLGMTAMPSEPGPGPDVDPPTDPLDLISGSNFQVQENYNIPGTLLATEPLLTGGTITPIQTAVPIGNATATVYTFITQVGDVCNSALSTAGSLCNGTVTASANVDVRRVVVAVQLDATSQLNNGNRQAPQYLTTIITNPVPSDQVDKALGLRIGLNVS